MFDAAVQAPLKTKNLRLFTQIYFDRSRRGAQEAGRKVANLFASAELKPLPRQISQLASRAMLTVVVLPDVPRHPGHLCASDLRHAVARQRPNALRVRDNAAIDELRERTRSRPVPANRSSTAIERSPRTDATTPGRECNRIDSAEKHKAVRLVYRMGSNEYWGVQMTDWDDAPVLADKSIDTSILGRIDDLY